MPGACAGHISWCRYYRSQAINKARKTHKCWLQCRDGSSRSGSPAEHLVQLSSFKGGIYLTSYGTVANDAEISSKYGEKVFLLKFRCTVVFLKESFPDESKPCSVLLCHKTTHISPEVLKHHSIPFKRWVNVSFFANFVGTCAAFKAKRKASEGVAAKARQKGVQHKLTILR